jgi:hypothetical protein
MEIKLTKLIPTELEREVLNYITHGTLIPPNQTQVATALKLKWIEAKYATNFWRYPGIVKEIGGKLYSIGQLN